MRDVEGEKGGWRKKSLRTALYLLRNFVGVPIFSLANWTASHQAIKPMIICHPGLLALLSLHILGRQNEQ